MRILFLTHRLPYAPNRGDRIRAYHVLRFLRTFADVDVVSFVHSREEASHVAELEQLATTVHALEVPRLRNYIRGGVCLPTRIPLTHLLLASPQITPALTRLVRQHPPDAVVAFCSGMAQFALEPPLAGLPLVLEMVDVDSQKWAELAQQSGPPRRWIYAREQRWLSRFEVTAARAAFATTVINDRERDLLAAMAPDARIVTVPSGIDLDAFRPHGTTERTRDVVFCGVMNYAPNENGAGWLATEVWPLVRRRVADATLTIVGSNPTARVLKLADADAGITVTGAVPAVQPYLWRASVAAAPLHTARGLQNKVLEAVAAGLPTVVTTAVANGLPREVDAARRVADTAAEFADAISELLAIDDEERRRTVDRAELGALGWQARLAPLRSLVAEAASAGRRGRT